MAKTAIDFIDGRGGATAVARATGHKPGAVALWRHRNKLPRAAWPEIIEAFPDVSLDDLKAIEARARKRAAA